MRTASSESPPFVAGLDGLRALAVVAVLAFHMEWKWASGGFLGVSLFFTLSGYLITQLIIQEHARVGRIDITAFWVRRLRRLMPAAVLVIAMVALAAVFFDRFASERLMGDLFAALGYAANWRFMSASTSYADLFTSSPSPVLHFWSLAIEEQFYVVFPLLMAGLFALRRRWAAPVVLFVLLASSVAAGIAGTSQNAVYYGTHTRAAEILAGAVLAFWLPLGGFRERSAGSRLTRSAIANSIVFTSVFALFVVLVSVVETGDTWLYSGGLAAMSALSVALIIGVQSPGVLRWCANRAVLVRIGGLSYGLYLFHWPIFLLVTEESTGWSPWLVQSSRIAITAVLAWGSSVIVEQPIRRQRVLSSVQSSSIGLVAALAACATIIAVAPRTSAPALAGLDAPDGFVNFAEDDALPRLNAVVIGSEPASAGAIERALKDGYDLDLVDATDSACPVGAAAGCIDPSERMRDVVARHRPDLVIAVLGELDRSSVLAPFGGVPPAEAAFFDATKAYVNSIVESASTTPVLLLDLGPADALSSFLEDAALRLTSVSTLVAPSDADIMREVRMIRSITRGEDDRERVMVIGDSTSYGLSVAIDRLAGDRINVLWAGGQNCPLVDVSAVKWWEGVEFDLERCPTLDVEWLAALDSFQPSIVLIAVSVPEQADQRYAEDPTWYMPGSEEYTRIHDEFVERFMKEMTARAIDVMILDSPAIHGGALGGAPFASAERISIWNGVISRWKEMWPEVTVVPWAQAMIGFEPVPGSLRGDGVHLLQGDLDVLASRAILPLLLERLFPAEQTSAVEAEAEPVE